MENNGWETLPLGEVSNNFDSKRIPVREANRRAGIYPYYGASGIIDFVDDYIFDGEYLLVAEDGENLLSRKTQVAFMASGKFWVNNHAHIIQGNERAITKFLYYFFQDADIFGYITGSAQPKLNQENLNRIPIFCPPIHEQEEIARILGALDDKIELNQCMNQTLEAMAQALFKSWFVDFDPVTARAEGRALFGMSAETAALFPAEFVNSELGAIPKGWRIVTAGEMVTAVGGTTPSTGNSAFWNGGRISWATPRDLSKLNDPVLLETERKITPAGLKQISSGLLPTGTLLMSSRAPVGYLAISEIPVAINQGFIAMLCNKGVPKEYVLQWLNENMETIISHANGTTFMEISKTSFRAIPGILPPEPLLLKFAEIAGKYHRMVVENLRQSRTLASIRDSLLPRMLSGEVRVKV